MIYHGEAWNCLDLFILVFVSPQARANSRDGHRVCDGLLLCSHMQKPRWTYWPKIPSCAYRPVHKYSLIYTVQFLAHLCSLPLSSHPCALSLSFVHSFITSLPCKGCRVTVPSQLQGGTYFIFTLSGHESPHKWMIGSSIRETGEEK